MSKETAKSALGILSAVLTWIIIAITVFMMIFTIFSVLTFDRNDRNLFGIRFYIVLTDSMSPSENNKDDEIHFNAGDIVLIKNVDDAKALQPGTVIAFISQNSASFGDTVTHKIRERRTNTAGELLGYVTYGTNTGTNDEALVEPAYVLGEYAGKLPGIGNFFAFLKTTPGYIVCILVPFLLLILWQGWNTVKLFKQYRQEQLDEMQAERDQLAKEREETAALLREVEILREQLGIQPGGVTAPVEMNTSELQKTDAGEAPADTKDSSDTSANQN